MKILVTGATGFVGTALVKRLLEEGHQINILTRDPSVDHFQDSRVKAFEWKNIKSPPPTESISGINGVINLIGENIASKRWSDEQKEKLRSSRVDSTVSLTTLLNQELREPLSFFISASAVGIYPVNQDNILDEDSRPGHGFLTKLCQDWESSAQTIKKADRIVIIRTAVVLEEHGGALHKMLPPFKLGLGGPIGDGNQFMSWIHLDDLVSIFVKAATDPNYKGVYNAAAPTPVDNFHFTKALGEALHRPTLFPVPKTMLKLAFGEMSSVILDSQKIISKRLQEQNFVFSCNTIEEAFRKIFGKQK